MKTNFLFTPGRLTFTLDAQAGSSGKGKVGSYICQNADNWQFCVNTFAPQAGHWVKLQDGRSFFYQTLNSCAHQIDKYEKMYIAPGAMIELPAFFREIEENNVPKHKIGISPIASILQDIDQGFERGIVDFDGKTVATRHDGTMKSGTTAHGVGACRARRVLRRPEAKYAKDIPQLREFICDVPHEIMCRLDDGQAGLMEIAQGFQLSYLLSEFFPHTTSRNCTVMAALDDSMIPPLYAGNVVINLRTYPIRISSKKYIAKNGTHLTWEQVQSGKYEYDTIDSNSGPGYSDQLETTWEEVTKSSGSPTSIMEITSVTKLPRRVFTFSKENLRAAIRYNQTAHRIYLSLNFVNYVDYAMHAQRGEFNLKNPIITSRVRNWIADNFGEYEPMIAMLGTGPLTEDTILIS
jgi:adenylosuccinate synthase